MVVSMGGLSVRAAVQSAASSREALTQLVGRQAVDRSPVRWDVAERRDHYVTEDGRRVGSTSGRAERERHVHVVVAPDRDPNRVLVQVTDRTRRGESRDGRGHHDFVLFLRKPSDSRIREAEQALASALKRTR